MPLGEVGLAGGRHHQVKHQCQPLTVGIGALAMTACAATGAVSTVSAMAHGGLPEKLEPMIGHGRGRNLQLTVVAVQDDMYRERWGGRDAPPVTNRGAMGPPAPEVGSGFADYAEP